MGEPVAGNPGQAVAAARARICMHKGGQTQPCFANGLTRDWISMDGKLVIPFLALVVAMGREDHMVMAIQGRTTTCLRELLFP